MQTSFPNLVIQDKMAKQKVFIRIRNKATVKVKNNDRMTCIYICLTQSIKIKWL